MHVYEQLHHDNGFLWSMSAVVDYKMTGNRMSRRGGMIAASHLASRFNLKGNFIRAWLGVKLCIAKLFLHGVNGRGYNMLGMAVLAFIISKSVHNDKKE
ncbi:hypothetical protein J7E73_26975 [Paenibacillus albidus]|uniref:hypothetical protein n=1 Tax=Paenibacillus albidus TaxID=2041023 RepID=UPI001BE57172|nr:hypothetical protein [Paenibacillus albidus]MBT2292709.1 hypothetical protein [Paenibacillus albidus]